MHLEVLVEEPSTEEALKNLFPKILGAGVSFSFHVHQGKLDLLNKLPRKLLGYRRWLPADWRIVVLVDEDRQDCHALKAKLEKAARDAGFATKASPDRRGRFQVLNRLAIEELEAWFFGDVTAIVKAYPRIPETLAEKAPYRDPDAISGGTWEALERVLQRAGYYRGRPPKIETARTIARFMAPRRNRSKSFQVFRDGLASIAR